MDTEEISVVSVKEGHFDQWSGLYRAYADYYQVTQTADMREKV